MDSYTRDGLTFDVTDTGPAPGSGPDGVIVLLHGFPQNRHQWDAVTPALNAAGYRTLAPDQRGYSPRARPSGRRAYRISELVDDVAALIDATGEDKVHLVGHDWGAQVAWSLASKYPERLHTLTAVSVPHPQAFTGALRHGQLRKSWYMLLFQLPVLPELIVPSSRGIALMTMGGITAEQMRGYVEPLGRDGVGAAINWYRALPFSQREKGYGRSTTVPTTYVWSEGDTALGRTAAEATERYVKADYRFEVLPRLSHWIPDEAPDELARIVLERVRG